MRVEDFEKRDLKMYESIANAEELNEIKKLGEKLRGLKVLHVNATAFGGGVAELLYALVPLMRSVGLEVEWAVMEAPPEFFNVTKKIHNMLQGSEGDLSKEELNLYEKVSRENAKLLGEDYDVVVIHDPQPAMIPLFAKCGCKLVWRCHIDLSSPNKVFWNRFKEFLQPYEKLLFHLEEYFPEDFKERSVPFPPSIDPLSDKNRELKREEIDGVAKQYGMDSNKGLITVVARFDPWKDLFSAIDVYRKVKEQRDVQLAVVSAMAHDDPEGWVFYEKVLRYAGVDDDIKFLTNLIGVGSLEVNAIQRMSKVGLHTATKEGFGLVISEMLWKGNPVVARPAGGVKIQVEDGVSGYLRWDVEELAQAVLELLNDEKKRRRMGENGKEKVRREFLITSHLLRYLRIFDEIVG